MSNPPSRKVRIMAGPVSVEAELNLTETARVIWEALPIEGRCNTWGDEIYFSIPVRQDLEDGRDVVELGDLGYWPPGTAFCIFFGPTPASLAGEIRPASPVTVVGKVLGDPEVLKQVASGAKISITSAA